MTRLSFSYPTELKQAIQKQANKEERSMSFYIQRILRDHLISIGIDPVTGEKIKKKSVKKKVIKKKSVKKKVSKKKVSKKKG